jgi:hypothetical protein
VSVPLANFAGRPFARDAAASLPLLAAAAGGAALVVAAAAGFVPPLEAALQFAPLEARAGRRGARAAQRTALALGALALPWVREGPLPRAHRFGARCMCARLFLGLATDVLLTPPPPPYAFAQLWRRASEELLAPAIAAARAATPRSRASRENMGRLATGALAALALAGPSLLEAVANAPPLSAPPTFASGT